MHLRNILRKKGRILGELEQAVLEALWDRESGTVRDVLAALRGRRAPAYTTVMTVMTRMVEKGYLKRQEMARGVFRYTPRYSREDFYREMSRTFFADIIENLGPLAVTQFMDTLEEIDPKQLEVLRKKLKNRGRHGYV